MMQAMRSPAMVCSIVPLLDESIICCNWGRVREAERRLPRNKPDAQTIALAASTALSWLAQCGVTNDGPEAENLLTIDLTVRRFM
jgi:hypothetical protein